MMATKPKTTELPEIEASTSQVRPFPALKTAPQVEAPQPAPQVAPAPNGPAQTPASAPAAAPTAADQPKKKGLVRRVLPPLILLALLGAGGTYGYHYWTTGRFMVTTDDAYVSADLAYVSPKITGYIAKVNVEANQSVKAGDPIVTIDDGDYRIALEQAKAATVSQNKTLDRINAQTEAGRASLQQAQAQKASAVASRDNAQRGADRARQLFATKVGTQAQLDDAATALDQANASIASADAQIATANANIDVLQAQYAEAQSMLATLDLNRQKAERDLAFTVLRAPFDGVVGNRSVELGDMVQPGQKLAAIVPVDRPYIVANYKETQLGHLVPGQKVRVTVDAVDGQTFEGTVSSLAPASGAVFSLLPPENATGNFTKVVQRVPVRIDVSPEAVASHRLRAGLSVVVSADTRTAPATGAE